MRAILLALLCVGVAAGCGGLDQPCCTDTLPCLARGTVCDAAGTCSACGQAGEPCCAHDACAPGLSCTSSTCG